MFTVLILLIDPFLIQILFSAEICLLEMFILENYKTPLLCLGQKKLSWDMFKKLFSRYPGGGFT